MGVYTNVDYIDLQLNGKSVSNGMQTSVNYETGKLCAFGYDANKNQIGDHCVETVGKAYGIELVAEYPGDTILSDGQDVALIEVKVVDSMGRVVPNAAHMIKFDIVGDGIIYGVGNGDPACHESDKGKSRSAFHGRARVIVQSILDQPGDMKLTASSDGLIADSITIYTV